MHMADALLSPEVGGVMWAATGATIALGSRALKRSPEQAAAIPMMGVVGAFVFATQMVNFAIPGTGSSGHFAGGMLLAILLGPHAAFLTIASVLVVQGFFFADGGLLAMGANIFNLGFVTSYIVYPLLYRPLVGDGGSSARRRAGILVSCVVALAASAFCVVLETKGSGIADLPFGAFVAAMVPVHLAIGVVEGLITVAVVEFVAKAEPDVVFNPAALKTRPRKAIAGLAVLAVLVGGVFSWFASTHPDGLEWSVAQASGHEELAAPQSDAHRVAAAVQRAVSILPDYAFPEAGEAEWAAPDAGTTLSGLLGGVLTLLIAGFAGWVLRRRTAQANAGK